MSMELYDARMGERKRAILKAIIEAHIQYGEPVGSKYLADHANVTCSPATIRNEMAELEALGYLEQPHTSSGRVPSELGYRFYVDSLIEHYVMTTNEIAQINDLLRSKMGELDHPNRLFPEPLQRLPCFFGRRDGNWFLWLD